MIGRIVSACPHPGRPVKLFHYTSLEALALILTNRSIRFSPLHALDDKQEARIADAPGLAQYVLVSSWTADENESIPMWSMYTSKTSGVRISMPMDPFRRHQIDPGEICSHLGFRPFHDKDDVFESFIPWETMVKYKAQCVTPTNESLGQKVCYTDNQEKLRLSPRHEETLDLTEVGRFKNKGWGFQVEWRYIIHMLPLMSSKETAEGCQRLLTKAVEGLIMPKFTHIDLDVRDDALESMEIMPSPMMTDGNLELLHALLEKNAFSGNLQTSKYKGCL